MTDTLVNRGTGAGGSNTNKTGLSFENITRIEEHLLELKFTKTDKGYYKKIYDDKIIYYASKKQFIKMAEDVLDIKKGELYKQPDEGYIIIGKDNIYVKILEKPLEYITDILQASVPVRDICYRQNIISLDTKNIYIEYAFCIPAILYDLCPHNTELNNLVEYLDSNKIKIFNGYDESYHINIKNWVGIN